MMLLLISCGKEDHTLCDNNLQGLKAKINFHCGTAVNYEKLIFNRQYAEILTGQFNSITAENSMKPSYLHPAENLFYFDEANLLADFCSLQKE